MTSIYVVDMDTSDISHFTRLYIYLCLIHVIYTKLKNKNKNKKTTKQKNNLPQQ